MGLHFTNKRPSVRPWQDETDDQVKREADIDNDITSHLFFCKNNQFLARMPLSLFPRGASKYVYRIGQENYFSNGFMYHGIWVYSNGFRGHY